MEEKILREEMKALWKETFGDSDEYINLVFSRNFHPELTAYHDNDLGVSSSILGVPYEFHSSSGVVLNGLYLCGIATRKQSRRQGIMGSLIEEINERAKEKGFDFTFLIPSSEGLRRYYRDRRYHDSFYKIKEYYVRGHNFKGNDDIEIVCYDPTMSEEVSNFLSQAGDLCSLRPDAYVLKHTVGDWKTVLDEADISGDPVYIGTDKGKIVSIAFTHEKEKEREIEIKKLAGVDKEAEYGLLGALGRLKPEANLTVVRDLEEIVNDDSGQVWSPFYARRNSKESEYEDISNSDTPYNPARAAYSFGMVRIFDLEGILHKTGLEKEQSLKGYSRQELLNIILRRPAGFRADALEKILDLPELSLCMSLLLE